MEYHRALYADLRGSEIIRFENDGETLRTTISGCDFRGPDFDSLQLIPEHTEKGGQLFTLNRYSELCGCVVEIEMNVSVITHGAPSSAILKARLTLGTPRGNGALTSEELLLTLHHGSQAYSGSGKSGWFEGELSELHTRLPEGTHIKSCFTCLYSDYSVYGHGLFGWMLCFRNVRQEYLRVRSKDDYFDVMDRHERRVQEMYLCPAYQRRIPGTGYRG